MRTATWLFSALTVALAPLAPTAASAELRPDRIKIEYVAPEKDDQKAVYEMLKKRQALEKVREMFSPVMLPVDVNVKTKTCGFVNAFYQRMARDAEVTLCYEYIGQIYEMMPEMVTPEGIAPNDAIVGQFYYTVGHEMGHALFDLMDVPIFGRPEDAADAFSTYIMLQMGKHDARRLIGGAAYAYKSFIDKPEMTIKTKAFSDVHGSSAQRFYNMICLGYGADPGMFADVVEDGLLPKQRADNCYWEHREIAYAFKTLIRPHLDPTLAAKVMDTQWLPPEQLSARRR